MVTPNNFLTTSSLGMKFKTQRKAKNGKLGAKRESGLMRKKGKEREKKKTEKK